MRSLFKAIFFGFMLALAAPVVGQAKTALHETALKGRNHHRTPSLVTLRVSAGYQNIYRDTAWTPVRATLHNGANANISGTIQIPESTLSPGLISSQSTTGLYQAPVTLPA